VKWLADGLNLGLTRMADACTIASLGHACNLSFRVKRLAI
jgi:hypothetical protein